MKAYSHILVPTDGTPLSLKAAKEAATLAKDLHARVTAVYVTPPWSPPMADESAVIADFAYSEKIYHESQSKRAQAALGKIERALAAEKVACEKVHANGAQPWESIISTAKSQKCDLIVMASHGRSGLAGLILGSETTKVLTHSKTPVLVCR
jgi:nucleotide-binding universal stress UspA family protein